MSPDGCDRRFPFTLTLLAAAILLATEACSVVGQQLMAAHENAAILAIKAVGQAEVQYYAQFGTYATSLAQLGPPAGSAASRESSDLIPKELAEGRSRGYILKLNGAPDGYAINAVPEQFGNSGRRTFYSDQSLVVRNNYSQEPATAGSPAAEGQ